MLNEADGRKILSFFHLFLIKFLFMKKILCSLFLVSIINTVSAQQLKKIDESSMLFIYNYQFCEEHKNPESVKAYEMALEVGKLYSRFYNINNAYKDSVMIKMISDKASLPAIMAKTTQLSSGLGGHQYCQHYIFKNYPSPGTTVFIGSNWGKSYRVDEKLQFEWTIDNNAKAVISGLSCKKATCRYAGRNYEAWFTPDIPINDGPYKFSGLPGLIIKLQDSEKEHIFELQEIKKVNSKPMYFPEYEQAPIATSAQGYTKALEANKAEMIEQLEASTFSDPAMLPRAIARVQKQNNFIERY
jgi:GLPGLI family protein